MRIQLAKCREKPCLFEVVVDLAAQAVSYEEFAEPPRVLAAGRVEWRGGSKYAVVGSLRADVSASCVRCLEAAPAVLERSFDLTFVPASSMPRHEPEVLDLDDAQGYDGSYEGEELELDPVIAEQFHLSIPMRFLCSADCPGLCPQCGARRGVEACDCREPAGDERLEVLRSLLER